MADKLTFGRHVIAVLSALALTSGMFGSRTAAAQQVASEAESPMLTRITVQFDNLPLPAAVRVIAKKAGLSVSYDSAMVPAARRVTAHATDVSVDRAFEMILHGTGLAARVQGTGNVLIIRVAQDGGMLSGRVIDSSTQKKIVGATVAIAGTRLSVVTNADGAFLFQNIPTGTHVLKTRLLGYQSKTISVTVAPGVPQPLTIVLSQTATTLSDVVTTVTGSQRKIEIGNDITTLDVPAIMKQAPITSVTDLLEARVPGLTVMRTSGVPGAPSRIRLRGMGGGLLSGVPGAPTNDPIVVVDGIRIYASQSGVDDQKLGGGKYPTPSPIDQIDPNSVEKIEVLKGPSASAMYGSDAANGVIVITTKKGHAGATRWDLTASSGIESMPGTYTAPGFYRFGHSPGGSASIYNTFCPRIDQPELYFACSVDSIVRFQALNEPRLSTIGRGTNNSLSGRVSGGASALTYSLTGSIANTVGLTKMPALYQDLFRELYDSAPSPRMRRPNALNTKGGQANFSAELSRGLQATYTTSLMQSVQYQSSANNQLATLASVYLDTLNPNHGLPGDYAYQLKADALTANHVLALNLLRWDRLPLTATLGTNRVERSSEGLTPRGIFVIGPSSVIFPELSKGKFTETHDNITTNTAQFNSTLFPRARMSLSFGAGITNETNASMAGVSDTLLSGISRPSTFFTATRSGRNRTTGGWFLEPKLNFNSRFFVNPGFRIDGGGASGSRGGFNGGLLSLFPKLNVSWVAIDRDGAEPLWGVVSLVRPRLALGVAGVQPASEWSVRTLRQNLQINNGVTKDLGVRINTVGNSKLGPEKTQEVEGGVDVELWETRVTMSGTGFYKMRKNAIQELPLAPSVGAWQDQSGTPLSYYANVGHVRNTGLEFTLDARVLDLPNFGWAVNLSVSKYKNTLVKLFGEQKRIDLGNGTQLVEGYPLFGRWSRPIAGWTVPPGGKKLWYGDYKVADSAEYMGMESPDFEMPLRTSFTFFRGLLSVNALFNYKAGLTQYNVGGAAHLSNIYEDPNATYGEQAYALAAACVGDAYAATMGRPCTDYGFIQKVNTLRFKSVSVAYSIPRSYLKRVRLSSASVSLQGNNLGLWTNYRGKDPDVNGNLIGDATQDSGQLPTPRLWSLQIHIGT